MKVWRDCLRGTFTKGSDHLMHPLGGGVSTLMGQLDHQIYENSTLKKQDLLQTTIMQYPAKISTIVGSASILNKDGCQMMVQLRVNNVTSGSTGLVRDSVGGHSFYISDSSFTKKLWSHAQTVNYKMDMSSLKAEYGGGGYLGILLLLYALYIYYSPTSLSSEL